jgi:hypothetical protein
VTVGVRSAGNPVPNAAVAVDIYLEGALYYSPSGVTDGSGDITFSIKNAPSGSYQTLIQSVTATGYTWDGVEDEDPGGNPYLK